MERGQRESPSDGGDAYPMGRAEQQATNEVIGPSQEGRVRERCFGQVHPGDVSMMLRDQSQHQGLPCGAGIGSEPEPLHGGPSSGHSLESAGGGWGDHYSHPRHDFDASNSRDTWGVQTIRDDYSFWNLPKARVGGVSEPSSPHFYISSIATHSLPSFPQIQYQQGPFPSLPWQPDVTPDSPPQWCFFGPPSAWVPCKHPHDGPCNASCQRVERDDGYWSEGSNHVDVDQLKSMLMTTTGRFVMGWGLDEWDDSDGMHTISSPSSSSSQWCVHEQFSGRSSSNGSYYGGAKPRSFNEDYSQDFADRRWAILMDEILCIIFQQLNFEDAKRCRLVCKGWRDSVDLSTEELTLGWLKSKSFLRRFSFLRKLNLTRCPSIRNKDLALVREAAPRIRHLELGSSMTLPCVTNKGLEQLGPIKGLVVLNLNECRAITGNGLRTLSSLTALQTLSLRGCAAVYNKGVQEISNIPSLTSLNLFGCHRIGDQGMMHLSKLTALRHLFLGKTRVKDEGLHWIGQCTTLRELFIFGEDVNDSGIIALHPLINLERLTLRETFSLEGNGIEELVQKVKGIKHLDLCNSEMDDEQFIAATQDWGKLESLDLRGCFISDSALHEVTHLTSLKSLSIEPFWDLPVPPQMNFMFSSFTSLTHLGLVGDSATVDMITAVGALPKLVELSIADHVFSENLLSRQPLNDGVVAGLASLTRLTSLDVSRQWLTKDQITLIAEGLPSLCELCVYDCKATDEEVESLRLRFPNIAFHKHIMKDGILHVKYAPGDIWAGQPNFF